MSTRSSETSSSDTFLSDTFKSFLAEVRAPIDKTLDRLLPTPGEPPARLHEAMRYSIFAGGKRIRPALTLIAADTLGVDRETVLPGAAVLEMLHTYSLIHDDLPAMDDDDLRRGRPTCHKQYDEATAILAGDSLLTLGLTLLAIHPASADPEARRRSVELVGEAVGTRGMIGGQVDDMAAESHWPDDAPAMLASIHRRKTGALLVASVRLAGVYADVDAETDGVLGEIGDGIGMMFQIADDILDIEGTSETLGKTAGKDAAVDKLTYPGLYGLDQAKTMLHETRDRTLDLARRLPGDGGLFPSLIDYLATRDR